MFQKRVITFLFFNRFKVDLFNFRLFIANISTKWNRGAQISTPPDMNRDCFLGVFFVWALSFVFIFAQSDSRTIIYLFNRLQKISLEQPLSEKGTFSEPLFLRQFTFWKELVCLFYKSLLPISTFLNFEALRTFVHILILCLHN